MYKARKKIVLIPAYEPDGRLIELLKYLSEIKINIVVVNDGSGEAYAPIFFEAKQYAYVLQYAKNRGKGSALKAGLSYIQAAFSRPYTVATADADGQHSPEDIRKVLARSAEKPDALILGSRRIEKHTPLRSRLGNTITRFVFRLASGSRVYDTQTGLRAFSDESVPYMRSVPGERYEYEMNMLMGWGKEKRPLEELWIQTIYLDGNSTSHFNTVKDSFRIYKEILRFSGASFISFLIDYGLFAAFRAMTQITVLSNVLARMISASVNYILNRKAVFGCSEPISKSAPRYALLAVSILLGNTIVLKELTTIGLPALTAKLITEILFFVVSWTVQRTFIFKKSRTITGKEMHVI